MWKKWISPELFDGQGCYFFTFDISSINSAFIWLILLSCFTLKFPWGKTSLVKKAAQLVDVERVIMVHMDMFPCKTEYDFYNAFSAALLTQTASRKELWMENGREVFLSDPVFSKWLKER